MRKLALSEESRQPYHEVKFLLPAHVGPLLAAYLQRLYPHSAPFARSILSTTYYDDAALSSYWESKDGAQHKTKFRLRRYLGAASGGADYSVEIKRRDGTLTDKTKLLITAPGQELATTHDFGRLLDGLDTPDGAPIGTLRCQVRTLLRPTVTVSCERLRFVNDRTQERYNLDYHIACVAMPGLARWRLRQCRSPYAIFEVKSPRASPAVPVVLPWFPSLPASFSKYAYGIATLLGEVDTEGKYGQHQ